MKWLLIHHYFSSRTSIVGTTSHLLISSCFGRKAANFCLSSAPIYFLNHFTNRGSSAGCFELRINKTVNVFAKLYVWLTLFAAICGIRSWNEAYLDEKVLPKKPSLSSCV